MKQTSNRAMVRGAIPMALLFILLVFLISPASGHDHAGIGRTDSGMQAGPPQPAVERLQQDTDGRVVVSLNAATGVASFVHFPREGRAAPLAMTPGLSAAAEAQAFFNAYGDVFGVQDAGRQLQLIDERTNFAGHTQLTYKQIHQGVDVFAGMLRVRLDGSNRIMTINGMFLPRINVNTNPSLSEDTAIARALSHVQRQLGVTNASSDLAAANTYLYIYREGLLQRLPGDTRLVYEITVSSASGDVREFVYVDAHSGAIVDQITGVHNDLDRKVSEVNLANVIWEDSENDPDPIPAGWEGGSAQQVEDWQNEIDGARESYNLFASMAGRDSYDGAGATMRTVNNDPNINCPNANWNGTSTNYCSGVTADDVVAHEWGHAYTEYTNGLIYQWQSGALNESYSDIWGETVDLLNGRSTDTPGGPRSAGSCSVFGAGSPSVDNTYRWLMGEDATAFNGAIRDLWNPTCYNDPGKVTDEAQYVCTTADSGGVHSNSGIPNHAYALMVDGGTYNGQTIDALGLTKAAHIHWAAQNMLTPSSNFFDHADALEAACSSLIGVNLPALSTSDTDPGLSGEMITAADCQEVSEVIAAVEFRTEPTFCGFEPLLDPDAPALCQDAGDVEPIFSENWEGGLLPAGWTVGTHDVANPATFDTPDWSVVDDLPEGADGDFAAFVADLIIGNCADDDETGALFLDSPVITVPASAGVPRVAFDHWVATEAGWDGGNVKISVNGGDWTIVPPSAFEFNPYNQSLNTTGAGNTNPLAGQAAFTGSDGGEVSGSWGQSQVNLSGIAQADDEVQFRFDFGVDGCNGLIGWYVDAVQVYTCSAELTPPNIDVDPDSLATTLTEGETDDDTLAISNAGETDLEWEIEEEVPSSALLGASGKSTVVTLAQPHRDGATASFSTGTALRSRALPAPPAADEPSAVPPGAVTITHSASQDITPGNSVWCPAAPGNSYLRVFHLVDEFDITSTFDVAEVEVGVQVAVSVGGSQPVTVNLYTLEGALVYANMTLIGTATVNLPDQSLSKVTVPVSGSVPPGSLLVVELRVPANNVTAAFLVGSNAAGESSPSYIVGPACGITEPIPFAAIGFPGIHVVMNVTGEVGDDFLPCTNPSDVPWLSLSSYSGTTAGGSTSDVTVTYDSTGLAVGTYEANLCISSNAQNEPLVRVPVTLTVAENQAPDCSGALATPASLWPANHKFRNIAVTGVTDADGDEVTITIGSIWQDEAVNAPDSGNTAPDGMGVGTSTAQVRAERVGTNGNGRVYHIGFTADDGQGGSCSGEVLVGVPMSQNGDPAVDDGANYDSTLIP